MSLSEDSGMKITPLGLGIGVVLALIVGFAAGGYFSGGTGTVAQSGFTVDDKNFLVSVANIQIQQITDATAVQSAALDWCTAAGGQWYRDQQPGTLTVTAQQAQELSNQGADVQQLSDGNYAAAVIVVGQGSCFVIPTANNNGG